MYDNISDTIYKKAKKIRTNLLLYTDKYIKQKQKKHNSNEILSLEKNNIYQKESMEVSFQEFYVESNIQIITHEVEKREKKIIPNLSSSISFHISENSLCIFKNSPLLSTAESIPKKNVGVQKNHNDFFNKKSKTKKEQMYIFGNNICNYHINSKNVNKKNNNSIKTFNTNLFFYSKKNNTIGKKYLRNLSKYLGVISHKKKKIIKFISINYNSKKKKYKDQN